MFLHVIGENCYFIWGKELLQSDPRSEQTCFTPLCLDSSSNLGATQLYTLLCLLWGLLWGYDLPGGGFVYPLQNLQTYPSNPVKAEKLSHSSYRAATNTSAHIRATLNPVPHMWLDSKHTWTIVQPTYQHSIFAFACWGKSFCELIFGVGRAHPLKLSMIRHPLVIPVFNQEFRRLSQQKIKLDTNEN